MATAQPAQDVSILTRQHDPDAEIFRSLYPALRRYAAVAGSLHDDPDDLVQEALARTLRRNQLSDLDNANAYLRRAITNLVIDRSRKQRTGHDRRHLVSVDAETTDVYPSDLDILDSLGPVDRSILYQVDIEGRAFSEVARSVGCTPVAARLRASRARKHLRTLLKETP